MLVVKTKSKQEIGLRGTGVPAEVFERTFERWYEK
jgi:hypothetical protein